MFGVSREPKIIVYLSYGSAHETFNGFIFCTTSTIRTTATKAHVQTSHAHLQAVPAVPTTSSRPLTTICPPLSAPKPLEVAPVRPGHAARLPGLFHGGRRWAVAMAVAMAVETAVETAATATVERQRLWLR